MITLYISLFNLPVYQFNYPLRRAKKSGNDEIDATEQTAFICAVI